MRLNMISRNTPLAFVLIGIVTVSFLMAAQTPATKGPVMRLTATTDSVSGAGDKVKIDLLNWSTDAERDQFLAAWTLTAAPAAGPRGGGARGAAPAGGRGGAGARGAAPPEAGATAGAAPGADGARGGGQDAPPAGGDAAAAGARGGGGGRGRGAGPAPSAAPATPESSLSAALQAAPTVGYLWSSESTGYSIRYAYRMPQPDGGERIILATDRRLGSWNNLWKPVGPATPTDYEFTLIEIHLNAKGEGEGKSSLTGKVTLDSGSKTIALDGYSALPVLLKGVKRQ